MATKTTKTKEKARVAREFEIETLADYLQAMSAESFERNYKPDWLSGLQIDFYFPKSKIGINYTSDAGDGQRNASLQAPNNERVAKYLKDNGIRLQSFVIGDVCKDGVIKLASQICDDFKMRQNKMKIKEISRKFIKTIVAEIQEAELDTGAWKSAKKNGYYPSGELPEDLPEESQGDLDLLEELSEEEMEDVSPAEDVEDESENLLLDLQH